MKACDDFSTWSYAGSALDLWQSADSRAEDWPWPAAGPRPLKILVTLGTIAPYRFDRAVRAVLDLLAPGDEVVPTPQAGEHVVFAGHFLRGFGLPVSLFFRLLLDTFDLQPHHLGPNAILYIASFVTLCEGYLGMLPFVELFRKLFYPNHYSVHLFQSSSWVPERNLPRLSTRRQYRQLCVPVLPDPPHSIHTRRLAPFRYYIINNSSSKD